MGIQHAPHLTLHKLVAEGSAIVVRRFAASCARNVLHLIRDERVVAAVYAAPDYLLGALTLHEAKEALVHAEDAAASMPYPIAYAAYAAVYALRAAINPTAFLDDDAYAAARNAKEALRKDISARQSTMLDDILVQELQDREE